MLGHVLATAKAMNPKRILVVVGPDQDTVAEYARTRAADVGIIVQPEPLGTADAVLATGSEVERRKGELFILYADSPLIRSETLRAMSSLKKETDASAVFLGFKAIDPTGYGRVQLNSDGVIEAIVEEHDASGDLKGSTLCNGGVLCADPVELMRAIKAVDNRNAAGELYLTSIVPILRAGGGTCRLHISEADEAFGANTLEELAAVEAAFQNRMRTCALRNGAMLQEPQSVRFTFDTELASGTTIGPYVTFGPGVRIAEGTSILPFSSLEGCEVGRSASVGPHARIRPGTVIGERARVGNFVEIKASHIGNDSRIGHLAYVGDSQVGARVNIGAGTITCNYDGVAKHRTEIGDDAFIGSNSSLIAPIRIGKGAYVGSGSVLTRDVEPGALAISRSEQIERPGAAEKLRHSRIGR